MRVFALRGAISVDRNDAQQIDYGTNASNALGVPGVNTGDPFAIGYFVGDANTPNSISEDDIKRYEQSRSLREEVRLLRKCPFCGSSVDSRR